MVLRVWSAADNVDAYTYTKNMHYVAKLKRGVKPNINHDVIWKSNKYTEKVINKYEAEKYEKYFSELKYIDSEDYLVDIDWNDYL